MMDSRRRHKVDNYNQEVTRTRSQHRKPPHGSWQPTVPSWEKKFCTLIGSVPWGKLMETKKIMHLYDNVVKWNDSAGEEAFHNAKNRYWAEINGLPCDISLPDPNIYIDEIDWNSSIDPELLLDLERDFVVPDGGEKDEKVVILGQPLLWNQPFSCNGWGEAEEDVNKVCNQPFPCNGWGEAEEDVKKVCNQPFPCNGWGVAEEDVNKVWNQPFPCNGWGEAEEDVKKVCNQPFPCNGWGEAEEDVKKVCNQPFPCNGWGEAEEDVKKVCNSTLGNNENPWERNGSHIDGAVRESGWGGVCNNSWSENQSNGAVKESGWGDGAVRENGWGDVCYNPCNENPEKGAMKGSGWDNSWGWNQWENNNYVSGNLKNKTTDGGWGTWDANNRNREGNRRSLSRYKTSRFHGDDRQTDRDWRNGKGRKRTNFAYEHTYTDKKSSSRQWNLMDSCGPVSHHGSGKAGNLLSWEKSVS